MGWPSSVDLLSWYTGADYKKQDLVPCVTSVQTIPFTQWYAHPRTEDLRGRLSVLGVSTENTSTTTISDKGAEVPTGWERYNYGPEFPHPDGDRRRFPEYNVPRYFYKHNSDKKAEFWYPIPV